MEEGGERDPADGDIETASWWARLKSRIPAGGSAGPSFEMARWVYVRGLGVIYLVAILSWWSQVEGLVGEEGIQPAGIFLENLEARAGGKWSAFWRAAPSLLWLGDGGDAWLHGLCAAGVVVSLLVVAGIWTGPLLFLLWLIYLSLVSTGGAFMNFQWDILLLEAGFLAPLLARWRLYDARGGGAPSRWIIFLHWWLLFRLMFFSGFVKLASGDRSWETCRALLFHYETQPIPNAIAWHVHQLPEWVHVLSCRAMFGIELAVPFLIFLGRWPRAFAFGAFAGFMGVIIVTGNYTFFNYLTILLAVLLLDDSLWPRRWKGAATTGIETEGSAARWAGRGALVGQLAVGGLVFLLTVKAAVDQGNSWHRARLVNFEWPRWVQGTVRSTAPFRSVGSYGLFADMTESRPEILIEGSRDGVEWREYHFRWKPGDLRKRPSLVAPHQPRLDWQMWFEALAAERRGTFDPRSGGWFGNFLFRLFEGSEPVTGLMEKNPFEGEAPRFLRARLFDYRFTDSEQLKATGWWWKREYIRDYCPPVSVGK